jgi:pimeloyl-ACP methyl ester carboxylesterase
MTHVDVNGARLWIDERGTGPAVLFVHGGLGDQRLWEPQAHALAARFRCVRYDLRFYGRSESPGMEFSSIADL